jgi:hypothetical protein
MKIVEAQVQPTEGEHDTDTAFSACVAVRSNGERLVMAARGNSPKSALIRAVNRCADELAQRAIDALKVGLSVTF